MLLERTSSETFQDLVKWTKRHARYAARGAVENMERMAPALASTILVRLADRYIVRADKFSNNWNHRDDKFAHVFGEYVWNIMTGAVMAAPVVTYYADKTITKQFPNKNQAEVARSILGLGVVAAVAMPAGFTLPQAVLVYGAYRGFEYCKNEFMKFIKEDLNIQKRNS